MNDKTGREALREAHRPVLRYVTGTTDAQVECACGWIWSDDDRDEPEGSAFMRHAVIDRVTEAMVDAAELLDGAGLHLGADNLRAAALATPSPDPEPLDFGSQIAMSGGLPKELKARIDAIQGRASDDEPLVEAAWERLYHALDVTTAPAFTARLHRPVIEAALRAEWERSR